MSSVFTNTRLRMAVARVALTSCMYMVVVSIPPNADINQSRDGNDVGARVSGSAQVFAASSQVNWGLALAEGLHHNVQPIYQTLDWLSAQPIGLKLCPPLASAFTESFKYFVRVWTHFVASLLLIGAAHLRAVLGIVSIAWILLPPSTVFPWLLKGVGIHIIAFYIVFYRIYSLQVHLISDLLLLFTGRKRNPLRHRVDSHEYNNAELTLGTMLMVVALLALPTTSVFYLLFCVLRLGLYALEQCLAGPQYFRARQALWRICKCIVSGQRFDVG
eukprot:m.352848 g.352848  ORF g.352848 m.352848 type:complete len:274 (+) comp16622_c0_seq1:94-915(+)